MRYRLCDTEQDVSGISVHLDISAEPFADEVPYDLALHAGGIQVARVEQASLTPAELFALGHALLAGHLDLRAPEDPARRPNMSRLLFLDPHCRELYADWRRKVRAVVGNLRIAVGASGIPMWMCSAQTGVAPASPSRRRMRS